MKRRWRRRGTALFVLAVACTQHQPLDTGSRLRDTLAERIGAAAAAELAVPFHIDDAIREVVDLRVSPAGSERQRVDAILDFIFRRLALGYALTPTRGAVDTFATREGNCLSFVNLFVGIARERRLNPFYVEVTDHQRWSYRRGMVVSQGHIVAGMMVDGELSTFDFLPYRPKAYREFAPIDDLTAIAHFYNNLGAEALMRDDERRAEELLELAAQIDPAFVKAQNNLGVLLLRMGRAERSLEVLERARERAPQDVAVLSNLARTYQQLGRDREAESLLERLEGIRHTSPFFFVWRAEAALTEGEPGKALELMREALRRDSETPEVHIGLVKAYLALGELEKAHHHLARALQLDATNEAARRLAVLLDGPGREGGDER